MNAPRSLPPEPPARGSFPLDHGGECKQAATAYLACIRTRGHTHAECRDASKNYLQCRMDKGLMAPEDLNTLGFSPDIKVVPAPEVRSTDGEIVAGLSSAKKKKGTIFGIGA